VGEVAEHDEDGGRLTGFREGSEGVRFSWTKVRELECRSSEVGEAEGNGKRNGDGEKNGECVRRHYTTRLIEAWDKPIGRKKSEWGGRGLLEKYVRSSTLGKRREVESRMMR
jgi:hypothetical protein